MDDHRFSTVARELDVRRQGPQLRRAFAVHPEPVEATLPDPHDRRILQQGLDPRGGAVIEGIGVMRVDAGRGPHTVELGCDLDRSFARLDVHAHADHPLHPSGPGGLDRDCRFLVHQEQVAMGIHRGGLDREFRVRGAHRAATIPGLNFG